jgi:hypothetical protein
VNHKDFIDYLNNLLKIDPDLVDILMKSSYTCNLEVANHPTIMCFSPEDAARHLGTDGKDYKVRFLGIINGFFGINEAGAGYICMEFDDTTGDIIRFKEWGTK